MLDVPPHDLHVLVLKHTPSCLVVELPRQLGSLNPGQQRIPLELGQKEVTTGTFPCEAQTHLGMQKPSCPAPMHGPATQQVTKRERVQRATTGILVIIVWSCKLQKSSLRPGLLCIDYHLLPLYRLGSALSKRLCEGAFPKMNGQDTTMKQAIRQFLPHRSLESLLGALKLAYFRLISRRKSHSGTKMARAGAKSQPSYSSQ